MLHIRPIYEPMTAAQAEELKAMASPRQAVAPPTTNANPNPNASSASSSRLANRRPSSAPPSRGGRTTPLSRTPSDLAFAWRDDDTVSVARSSISQYLRGGGSTRLRRRSSTGSLLNIIDPPLKKYHTKWYKEDPDKRVNLMHTALTGSAWKQYPHVLDPREQVTRTGLKRSMSCGSIASVNSLSTFRTRRSGNDFGGGDGGRGGESTFSADAQMLHDIGTRAHCPVHLADHYKESYDHVPSKMWWVQAAYPLTKTGGGDRVSFENRGPEPWPEIVPTRYVRDGTKLKRLPSYATIDASGMVSLDADQIFRNDLEQTVTPTANTPRAHRSPRAQQRGSSRSAFRRSSSLDSLNRQFGTPQGSGAGVGPGAGYTTPTASQGSRTPGTTSSRGASSQRRVRYSPPDGAQSALSPRRYMSPTMSVEARTMSRMEEDPAYVRQLQRKAEQTARPSDHRQTTTAAAAAAPPPAAAERVLHNDLVVALQRRLEEALLRVNPDIDPEEIRLHQRYVFSGY